MSDPQLLLASQSPRRRDLLTQMGLRFEIVDVHVSELVCVDETPLKYVQRVAMDKAQAGWDAAAERGLPVLGADTTVVFNQQPLGKPKDREDAINTLLKLSGTEHQVATAVAVVNGEKRAHCLSVSEVVMRQISEADAVAYWNSGEPIGKAGSYGLQGLGAVFIQKVTGSPSGIVGLPLYETAALLAEFGIAVLGGLDNLDG